MKTTQQRIQVIQKSSTSKTTHSTKIKTLTQSLPIILF